jgi:hypothetical protein
VLVSVVVLFEAERLLDTLDTGFQATQIQSHIKGKQSSRAHKAVETFPQASLANMIQVT